MAMVAGRALRAGCPTAHPAGLSPLSAYGYPEHCLILGWAATVEDPCIPVHNDQTPLADGVTTPSQPRRPQSLPVQRTVGCMLPLSGRMGPSNVSPRSGRAPGTRPACLRQGRGPARVLRVTSDQRRTRSPRQSGQQGNTGTGERGPRGVPPLPGGARTGRQDGHTAGTSASRRESVLGSRPADDRRHRPVPSLAGHAADAPRQRRACRLTYPGGSGLPPPPSGREPGPCTAETGQAVSPDGRQRSMGCRETSRGRGNAPSTTAVRPVGGGGDETAPAPLRG